MRESSRDLFGLGQTAGVGRVWYSAVQSLEQSRSSTLSVKENDRIGGVSSPEALACGTHSIDRERHKIESLLCFLCFEAAEFLYASRFFANALQGFLRDPALSCAPPRSSDIYRYSDLAEFGAEVMLSRMNLTPPRVSREAVDLVCQMLVIDRGVRPHSAQMLAGHPFCLE